MTKRTRRPTATNRNLPKALTGVQGLDEITGGGLPRGRPTLICGSAGAGKTLLAMEFLVRGATEYNEPGVFVAFEETEGDLTENVRSLGFDLELLARQKRLVVDYVRLEPGEIDETGDYDLEGLFIRLGSAIDTIGAKRVVLDTIENLFSGLQNEGILRAELRRLFHWLKEKGVTAVITAERGDGALTRRGLEEYVSDCVILLDHRVAEQISIRRLRIVKYRGTSHGTNEYPFLIDEDGFSVLPVTSLGLQHTVSDERISSGISKLDTMLGGKGFYRGSTILVSGTAGTGKTSLSAHFVDAACRRGERSLYLSFEESPGQLIRNAHSIGIELAPWVDKSVLQFHSSRPTLQGLEMHLATIHKLVETFKPEVVVLDPIDSLIAAGNERDANMMLIRLIDFLKLRLISALFTNLTPAGGALEKTELKVSSLADTWLLMRDIEQNGERNRAMYVLKSRGMPHSNKLREFLITEHGFDLLDDRQDR
jgi:circadian clock protein KaiC